MRKLWMWKVTPMALLLASGLLSIYGAQTTPPKSVDDLKIDNWNSNPLPISAYKGWSSGPAPRRDLSGMWDATGEGDHPPRGIQDSGADAYRAVPPGRGGAPGGQPDEKSLPSRPPYTALGEATLESHKPNGVGVRQVPSALANDPVAICDPPGFPRLELHEFRNLEISQSQDHMLVAYQSTRTWRTIWMDGRELPKNPEPRWDGYSVGKWTDDYTFVVDTVGISDRTWVDNAGRPHSGDLKVEEQFHRVNHDLIELTLTIDDPKMYTKPWQALSKFPLRLQPRGFDVREQYCSPVDVAQYNQDVGEPILARPNK
jgi:hypothetical protein